MQSKTSARTCSRRDFLRLAGTAAVGAIAAACRPAASPAPAVEEKAPAKEEKAPVAEEEVKLAYTSWGNETRLNSDKENTDAFMEQNPNIEVEFIGIAQDYQSQVLTMIAGGTPPDVLRINAWDTQALYARGTCLALDSYFDQDGVNPEEIFVEPFVQCVYKGTWYGILRGGTGAQIVYYNKPMFDEAGVEYPADPDWKWDDLLTVAKQLTVDKDGDGKTDQWGFDFWTWNDGGWQTAVWGNGGAILNEERTKCLLDQPEAYEAVQWWADLRCQENAAPTPAQIPEGLGNPFFAGMTAMVQSGTWAINTFLPTEFDWGVQIWPAGPAKHVSYSKPNGCSIYAQTAQVGASWTLLKYFFSEECAKHDAETGLWPPNLKSLMFSDWYRTSDQKPYDLSPTVPGLMAEIHGLPLTTNAAEINSAIWQEMQLVLNCEATAKEAMESATKAVDELLAQMEG
jgi:multiple sugar transport system substrate-binding protein